MTNRSATIVHCFVHTIVSAAPSFAIAYGTGWNRPSQIVGMICGIVAFLGFAIFLHLRGPLAWLLTHASASRAIRWTKWLRIGQVLVALPMALSFAGSVWLAAHPWLISLYEKFAYGVLMWAVQVDIRAGALSVGLLDMLYTFPDQPPFSTERRGSALALFSQALFATLLEGLILALAMAAVAAILWAPTWAARRYCKWT